MKGSMVEKTLSGGEITPEQLEEIGKYTRRTLKVEELFVFSLLLCDNEVDRDGERFPKESLDKLAELYLGKTGVFDHLPKAENQSARIFETQVTTQGKNSLGEEYAALKAWAYMVRCPKNEDLILEIDAGIKKEVSVGCAVEEVRCSVCGENQRTAPCAHRKGESYGGVPCHHLLVNPTDAYEWSFVAVPAQKKAGVIKRYGQEEPTGLPPIWERLEKAEGGVQLSAYEVVALRGRMKGLLQLSQAGGEYLEALRREIVRDAHIAQPQLDSGVLEQVCKTMDLGQLKAFHKGYEGALAKAWPAVLQLDGRSGEEETPQGNQGEFLI